MESVERERGGLGSGFRERERERGVVKREREDWFERERGETRERVCQVRKKAWVEVKKPPFICDDILVAKDHRKNTKTTPSH